MLGGPNELGLILLGTRLQGAPSRRGAGHARKLMLGSGSFLRSDQGLVRDDKRCSAGCSVLLLGAQTLGAESRAEGRCGRPRVGPSKAKSGAARYKKFTSLLWPGAVRGSGEDEEREDLCSRRSTMTEAHECLVELRHLRVAVASLGIGGTTLGQTRARGCPRAAGPRSDVSGADR